MLCCVCLLDNPKNMSIFDDNGQQLEVAEIIYKYLWFKPEPDNIMTREICNLCWQKIYDFHIFYRNAEKTHKEYQQNTNYNNIKTEISFDNSVKLEQDYDTCNENINHQLEEEITSNTNCELETIDDFEIKNPLEVINSDCVPYIHETDEEGSISSDEYDDEDLFSDQNTCYEKEFSDDKETPSK
ncbi:hypothetical protein DOY81_013261 [Sarcophaga bullata]|nr:hypothetical protein DOY81_013261 [Sarcophaga bullata]